MYIRIYIYIYIIAHQTWQHEYFISMSRFRPRSVFILWKGLPLAFDIAFYGWGGWLCCCNWHMAIHGQFSKVQPSPRDIWFFKGHFYNLKWIWTMVLGFETLDSKLCKLKVWELTVSMTADSYLFISICRRRASSGTPLWDVRSALEASDRLWLDLQCARCPNVLGLGQH